ncbi:alpha/beta fold hydrolase [Aspergillus ibericus CBS 121593]|uniref:Alpha/beta fold family hydrolase n=1 Tax=Aspergillus ibericus CBS 121593 TaxID=1448316 RepID=A0A395HBW4_9EURO|nr:alpha/beta fold family hydrolase [Aspergillus ibericus CBS 121593]RAL03704.1 alpha/beta fold family hydrolase [Aspergillus ibericus CBS 121593]
MPLSTHEHGTGLPILILHGWQLSGHVDELDFEPIFSTIPTPNLHRIYIDLPGMGHTPAHNIHNLDDIYHQLVEFIDSRFGKARFLIIGSSCGGYLARALAQKYIDQVDGLLLRVPLIEPADSLRDVDVLTPLIQNKEVISELSDHDKSLLGNIPIQTPSYIQALKTKYEEAYIPAETLSDAKVLDPIRGDPTRYRLSFDVDEMEKAGKFPAPTLIVCGRQDGVVGYRDGLRLVERYSRATFVVLDRGTHGVPVDGQERGVFGALLSSYTTY